MSTSRLAGGSDAYPADDHLVLRPHLPLSLLTTVFNSLSPLYFFSFFDSKQRKEESRSEYPNEQIDN